MFWAVVLFAQLVGSLTAPSAKIHLSTFVIKKVLFVYVLQNKTDSDSEHDLLA